MSNPGKSLREHMEKKTPDELLILDFCHLDLVCFCIITPTEPGYPIVNRKYSVVGYGYSVGISSQIGKHSLCSLERLFAIDTPILCITRFHKGIEGLMRYLVSILSTVDD